MKCAVAIALLCLIVAAQAAKPKPKPKPEPQPDHEAEHQEEGQDHQEHGDHHDNHDAGSDKCDFQEYMKKFGKKYESQEEQDKAEAIFKSYCQKIEKHNSAPATRAAGKGYEMAPNQFSDLPKQEFLKKHTGLIKLKRNSTTRAMGFQCAFNPAIPQVQVPPSFDARQLGLVNKPIHQGNCGDCYAFSSTGAMEAAYKRIKGVLPKFSEQQIASCSGNRPNMGGMNFGCDGGDQSVVYEYVNANGIELFNDYPYASGGGNLPQCMQNPAKYKTKVTGCGFHQNTQSRMNPVDIQKLLVKYGALAASMDASGQGFKGYKRGIYRGDNCGKTYDSINHAVLLVGYGSENGQDFWIVKNSWGPEWGEGGFFRIARGINECAFEMDASYVTTMA